MIDFTQRGYRSLTEMWKVSMSCEVRDFHGTNYDDLESVYGEVRDLFLPNFLLISVSRYCAFLSPRVVLV